MVELVADRAGEKAFGAELLGSAVSIEIRYFHLLRTNYYAAFTAHGQTAFPAFLHALLRGDYGVDKFEIALFYFYYRHAKKYAHLRCGKPCAVLHDSRELKDARAKLHAALAPYAPDLPLNGPVELVVKWLFPSDGRHADGEWKTTKPDTDNLEKALKDEMTRLNFWRDDAQVSREICEKFWAEQPGIFVRVEGL